MSVRLSVDSKLSGALSLSLSVSLSLLISKHTHKVICRSLSILHLVYYFKSNSFLEQNYDLTPHSKIPYLSKAGSIPFFGLNLNDPWV